MGVESVSTDVNAVPLVATSPFTPASVPYLGTSSPLTNNNNYINKSNNENIKSSSLFSSFNFGSFFGIFGVLMVVFVSIYVVRRKKQRGQYVNISNKSQTRKRNKS